MTKDTILETYMMNSKKVIAEMLYDTIENYESRTCENCKHGDYRPDGGNTDAMETYCSELRLITNQDFGCNKFERLDND